MTLPFQWNFQRQVGFKPSSGFLIKLSQIFDEDPSERLRFSAVAISYLFICYEAQKQARNSTTLV